MMVTCHQLAQQSTATPPELPEVLEGGMVEYCQDMQSVHKSFHYAVS